MIKEARKGSGVSQAELSEKIGISRPYLSQIEAGERPLKANLQMKIAGVLGVEPEALISFGATSREEDEIILSAFRCLSEVKRKAFARNRTRHFRKTRRCSSVR